MRKTQTKMAKITRPTGNNVQLEVSATEAWRIVRALEKSPSSLDRGVVDALRAVFAPKD